MDNEQSQILLLLGEIKGQISGFATALADVKITKDDHESRLRELETQNSKQNGVVIGVTAVATSAASIIAFVAQHYFG